MARPILFPQFTINAGLLLLGAVICWRLLPDGMTGVRLR
jgi:hypothetical protein